MMRKTILAILLFLTTSAVGGGEVQNVLVSIDLSNPGAPFSRDLLGVNVDAEDAHEPNYTVSRYYDCLNPLETPLVRYPGGLVSNHFRWAQTLGPTDRRMKQWSCDHGWQFQPHLGAGEYLKLLNRLGARGMITLNMVTAGPEEAGAWVAFCRGRIGDARPIGTDAEGTDWKTVGYWAQRRLEETGLREPANVVYWEIGNEVNNGITFRTDKDYCAKARLYAEMLRRIDPVALIGWLLWDREEMGGRTDLIDFLVYHSYKGWPQYPDGYVIWKSETLTGEFECERSGEYRIEFKAEGLGITEPVVQAGAVPRITVSVDGQKLEQLTLESKTRDLSYTRRLEQGRHRLEITFLNDYYEKGQDTNIGLSKVFSITGGGKRKAYEFPSKESDLRKDLDEVRAELTALAEVCRKIEPRIFIGVTEYNRMEHAVRHFRTALYTAGILGVFSENPTVRAAEFWEACSTNFGAMGSSAGVRRPVHYVFEMMKELQDRIVPAVVTPEDKDIRILATKDSMSDEASILLMNLGETPKKLILETSKGFTLLAVEKEFLSASDLWVDNEKAEQVKLNVEKMEGNLTALDIPAYSVTMIKAKVKQDMDTNR